MKIIFYKMHGANMTTQQVVDWLSSNFENDKDSTDWQGILQFFWPAAYDLGIKISCILLHD